MPDPALKFKICTENIGVEGTVSQICYICPGSFSIKFRNKYSKKYAKSYPFFGYDLKQKSETKFPQQECHKHVLKKFRP